MKSQVYSYLQQKLMLTSLALDLACQNLAGITGTHPLQLRANILREIEHQLTLHSPDELEDLYRSGKTDQ